MGDSDAVVFGSMIGCHTLQEHDTVTTDCEGKKYAGIDLKCNYKSCTYQLTMEDYIRQLLIRYGHPAPRKP